MLSIQSSRDSQPQSEKIPHSLQLLWREEIHLLLPQSRVLAVQGAQGWSTDLLLTPWRDLCASSCSRGWGLWGHHERTFHNSKTLHG